ncbi:MAG TPA: hypothetical protein VMD59_15710, partial [Acidimicrobiales bacterium]|nr:hypothetical protein [Acidimicrobiales bacterium]
MKLAILGGGGVRMPAFVHALLSSKECLFDDIALFEPDALRRATTARLAAGVAAALGHGDSVRVTAEVEEAFNGADFVFSAIRVGGDGGRIIDEEVALSRGIVGQETTGPGGAAMALRTIPVVLDYCRILARVAPRAVLVNFTNPAGIVTEAITRHSGVRAVGVCDTPSGTIEQLAAFLHLDEAPWSYSYGGLNHLGWITSLCVDGEERLGELLEHYELLQRFDHRFAAHDADLVRRVGALPTEYVFYYYDPRRYLEGVRHAGSTRGKDVARLNEELLVGLSRAFASGESAVDSFNEAWALYCKVMGVRRDTYLRIDTDGESGQQAARAR